MPSANPAQQRAIEHVASSLLVLAGAGSGKTRVITQKIARLCRQARSTEGGVFAVTFTNKAAREMRERLSALIRAEDSSRVHVSTFHSLGMRMLREDAPTLGLRRNFSIFDSQDSESLLLQLASESGHELADPGQVRWQISRWKNDLVTPQTAIAEADSASTAAAFAYARYNEALQVYNAVDFDDLVVRAVELVRDHAEVREKWRARIDYLLVDEYQDTNNVQYALVRELIGERGALTVVGDDDQSIYAWRGARPENLQRLAEDFAPLEIIKLEQNYRSSGRVLRAANHLIANNPHLYEKSLWSEHGPGEKLLVLPCRDGDDEAERIVTAILSHRFQRRTNWRDYAVLYRGNHQSKPVEQALRAHNIPYQVSGGSAFFDRSEIKDLLAYLRLLTNPMDDSAFLRIANTPRREIGPAAIEKLSHFARERHLSLLHAAADSALSASIGTRLGSRLADFGNWIVLLADNIERGDTLGNVRALLSECNYMDWLRDTSATPASAEQRIGNVEDFMAWLVRLESDRSGQARSLAEIVAQITVLDVLDRNGDEAANAVQLMTLHAAKGLEFPFVYLAGMEESLLPHHQNTEGEGLEEERRLAYVGITRAQRELTFTYAAYRKRHGALLATTPSRFLDELPRDDLSWEGRETRDEGERLDHGRAQLASLRAMLADRT